MLLELHAFLLGHASLADWAQFKGTGPPPVPFPLLHFNLYFGRHITKTKLRIDNITAKEALKFDCAA
jgi:hypothetical protein